MSKLIEATRERRVDAAPRPARSVKPVGAREEWSVSRIHEELRRVAAVRAA